MSWTAGEPRVWLRLRWPRLVEPEQVTAALRGLHGLSRADRRQPLVLETIGQASRIEHRLGLAASTAFDAATQLRSTISGCEARPLEPEQPRSQDGDRDGRDSIPTLAARLQLTDLRRPLHTDQPERFIAGLLSAMVPERADERLVLQLILGPTRAPLMTPQTITPSGWANLFLSPTANSAPADERRAYTAKHSQPGWRAAVQLGVWAGSTARAQRLLHRLGAVLRSLQAPGVSTGLRPIRPAAPATARPWRLPLALNLSEAAQLGGWPLGALPGVPIERCGSRLLPPDRRIPSHGRVLGQATFPGARRRLAISVDDSTRHMHLLGPTGVGKSTVMVNLITQDIRVGNGVVVVDPKGDLVGDVLARVPKRRRGDVVVLDPTDDDRPVGLNPLSGAEGRSELVADQLLAIFRRLYAGSWGPRLQEILHAGLLSVAAQPDLTLCHLPRLYLDDAWRRRLTAQLATDPALGPFWAWYDNLSQSERSTVLAPVMNKLRAFLLRPSLRGVIGQSWPRFRLDQALERHSIVLVNLAKGRLGPEGAQLFGGLVISQLWQAILGRQGQSPEHRHPVFVFLDEFQDYLSLPTDLADVLAQARSFGVSLTLAHQHLHQLSPELRAAVLTNARSRLVFQTAHEDAAVLVRSHPELETADLTSLGAFEAYLSVVAERAATPYASVRTLPPPPIISDPEDLRGLSRQRWGVDRAQTEAALVSVPGSADDASDAPIGRRRRATSGGTS